MRIDRITTSNNYIKSNNKITNKRCSNNSNEPATTVTSPNFKGRLGAVVGGLGAFALCIAGGPLLACASGVAAIFGAICGDRLEKGIAGDKEGCFDELFKDED